MVCGTHQAHINSPHAHTPPHITIGHTVTLKTTQNNSPMKWGLKRIRNGSGHANILYFRNWRRSSNLQVLLTFIPPLSPSPWYLTKIRCFHVVQIGGCSLTSEFKAKLWRAGDSWGQDVTRTRNLAGNDQRWVGSGSEETNSNSILDKTLQEPTWPWPYRECQLKTESQIMATTNNKTSQVFSFRLRLSCEVRSERPTNYTKVDLSLHGRIHRSLLHLLSRWRCLFTWPA